MSAVTSVLYCPCVQRRPIIQTMAIPFAAIYVLFLRAMAALSSCFRMSSLKEKLLFKAVKLENWIGSLWKGMSLFGKELLVVTDNHGKELRGDLCEYQERGYCRGVCYDLIQKHLENPEISLRALALEYSEGVSEEVSEKHDASLEPPLNLQEEPIFAYRLHHEWEDLPKLENFNEGSYSFRIGIWNGEEPIKAHRIAFFKNEGLLFDPRIGLAKVHRRDWIALLKDIAEELSSYAPSGSTHFTIECFKMTRGNSHPL